MKMHMLSGGHLRGRRNTYFPDAPDGETIELPVSCVLLRHAQGNVLFDTGCHPSIADDAEARWGSLAKLLVPIMTREDTVLSGLKAIGVAPGDIDVVICSHLHTDHCGCNAFFGKATVILHAQEIERAKSADAARRGYFDADWDCGSKLQVISDQLDVMGDGRIVLVPLPGHTPGMMGALVEFDRSGRFLLASDAVSVRENLDRNIIPRNTWNAEHYARSFDEIGRLERAGYQVICGHDAPQWAQLRKGMDAYD
jgi:glyoxylase-like metal-dependent hydrolase (beta-lactamase superfamily II)